MEQSKMTPAKEWEITRSDILSEGGGYHIDIEMEGPETHMDLWVHGEDTESEVKAKYYVNSIVSAINNTFGASIDPAAVPNVLEALKWVRESPQFKRMDWKLKVTIDAAIDKAKLP